MPESYLGRRLRLLKESQNADGGWGYFPGKRSWLEPTAYTLLALHQEAGTANWDKGWNMMRQWQREDGAWRPTSCVEDAHWATALAITLHCVRGVYDGHFRNGVDWLLDSAGVEGRLLDRMISYVTKVSPTGHDLRYRGWPWRPGTASWIEPTAHSLVALKKAAPQIPGALLKRRIILGEGMILRRRCTDGGWNYGSKEALGVQLPSYPETTALALLGLQGNRDAELGPALARAKRLYDDRQSPLGSALLKVSLRAYGLNLGAESPKDPSRDLLVASIESIGCADGCYSLLRPAA